ncbi:MAG: glycosyltransferase family 39 protein, partial [Edaphobacter sp.]
SALRWHFYALVPLTTLVAILCGYYALTAPKPTPGTDIVSLLAMAGSTEAYNLSLSHVTDLTASAMSFFRGPLAATALGMLGIGIGSYLLRRRNHTYAANLTLAAAMTLTLLAAHEGLARFYPILGSKGLALAINQAQQAQPHPDDLILIDGELTAGSTLIFYTGQQVHLINGRVNGLWYGSFWPASPHIFETEDSLRQLWTSPRRIFLFTYNPDARTKELNPYGAVHTLATAGGKTILTNY